MARFFTALALTVRRPALAAAAVAVFALPTISSPALSRGPDSIADVAEKVIDAVVNISTSQSAEARPGGGGGGNAPQATPQLPPGSPFEEFFEEFFKNRRGQEGGPAPNRTPRRVNSLGSGFVIDPVLRCPGNHPRGTRDLGIPGLGEVRYRGQGLLRIPRVEEPARLGEDGEGVGHAGVVCRAKRTTAGQCPAVVRAPLEGSRPARRPGR
jgi:hypothetical protein